MKRQIVFENRDQCYALTEANQVLFEIKTSTLKFDSAKFYEGVYKGKSIGIDLSCAIKDGTDRTGTYVYSWMKELIDSLNVEFVETVEGAEELHEVMSSDTSRVIPLFDMPACAGDGFYADASIPHKDYTTTNCSASFAVRISGHSMEPTIPDESIVLVEHTDEYNNDDIVIVNYAGDTMCKRYKKLKRGANLIPDNESGDYKTIKSNQIATCCFQGKVIDIVKPQEKA